MDKGRRKDWPLWLVGIIFLLILAIIIWNCYHRRIHGIRVETGAYKEIYYTFIDSVSDYGENDLLNKMVRLDSESIDISTFPEYNFKVAFYDNERNIIIITRDIKEYTDNPLYYYLFKNGELLIDLISVVDPEGDVIVYAEYSNYYDYVLHQGFDYIIKGVVGIIARVVIGLFIIVLFAYAILELKEYKAYVFLASMSILKLIILNTFFFNGAYDIKTLIFFIPIYEIIINVIEYKTIKKKIVEYDAEKIDGNKLILYYVLSNIFILIVTYFSLYFVPMI